MSSQPTKQPDEKDRSAPKSSWRSVKTLVTIVSVVVVALTAVFAVYQTIQKDIWENRLKQKEEELARRNQELDKVKEELKPRVEREARQSQVDVSGSKLQGTVEVTVMKSQPLSVSDDLNLTLTDIRFEPDGYRISGKATSKKWPEMQISNAKEEAVITYPKEHGYDIKILKIDSVSAKVSITKNP